MRGENVTILNGSASCHAGNFAIFLQRRQRQLGINARRLMRFGGGDDLKLLIHSTGYRPGSDVRCPSVPRVTAHHVRLVFNCARHQRDCRAGAAQVIGDIQRQVVIVAVCATRPGSVGRSRPVAEYASRAHSNTTRSLPAS